MQTDKVSINARILAGIQIRNTIVAKVGTYFLDFILSLNTVPIRAKREGFAKSNVGLCFNLNIEIKLNFRSSGIL